MNCPEPRQIGWAIFIVWRNVGLSPALGIRGYGDGKKFGLADNSLLAPPPIDPDKRPTSGTVAPHKQITTRAITLTYDECNNIALGDMDVFAYGRMGYRDGFKDTPARHTDVCFKIGVGANPRTSKAPFTFSGHHEHNHAD